MNRIIVLCAMGASFAVLIGLAMGASNPAGVNPIPNTPYTPNIQRVEHEAIMADTTRCVRADWGASPLDGGNLLGYPPAADAAVGPQVNISYTCRADTTDVCWKANSIGSNCQYAKRIPSGIGDTPPMMFPSTSVTGICAGGASTCSMECCAAIPTIAIGK